MNRTELLLLLAKRCRVGAGRVSDYCSPPDSPADDDKTTGAVKSDALWGPEQRASRRSFVPRGPGHTI